ncbi:MAG: CoA-transferase subunit beta [Candidatus Bathyarchaeia archaeon]
MGSEKPTVWEVMATAVAHELKDDEKWFIGLATGEKTRMLLQCVPIVGMALAQHTHAPNSTMLVAGWIHNPIVREIPTGMESEFGTELKDWRCEAQISDGGPTICYRRGDVDVGFGSAAQIDKYGNCNIVCIGNYHKPKVRLIGPIFQPGHFSLFGKEIIIVDHEKRNFVDRVDYISGVGYLDGPGARERLGLIGSGPCMVLTDLAVFDFDEETKLIRLKSVHPGVTVEQVRENTGFTHEYIPKRVPTTPLPTPEELRIIREVIDPRGVLFPR